MKKTFWNFIKGEYDVRLSLSSQDELSDSAGQLWGITAEIGRAHV